jgi:hypothetical protein
MDSVPRQREGVVWIRADNVVQRSSSAELIASRFTARLVILLLFACVSLALYDLCLLAAGLR